MYFFTDESLGEIRINWTSNSGGTEDNFIVHRSDSFDGFYAIVGIVGTGVTNYLDTDIDFNSTFFYKIQADGTPVNSGFSEIESYTSLPLPTPDNITFTNVSIDSLDVNWDSNSGGVEDGFTIERSLDDENWSVVGSVGSGVTIFNDSGLTLNTNYYYRVKADSSKGDSEYSVSRDVTTLKLPAPSDLLFDPNIDRVKIDWTSNSSGLEDGFEIQRSLNGVNGWSTVGNVGTSITTFTDTGLTQSTTYFYRVRATDVSGNSDYSEVGSSTTLIIQAPTNLILSSFIYHTITANWTSNSGGEEDGFSLERSLTELSGFVEVQTVGSDITTVEDKGGLKGNTTYYYRVRATDSSGDSQYSNTDSLTTGNSDFDLVNANSDTLVNDNLDQLVNDP